jgi:hypothetical protein
MSGVDCDDLATVGLLCDAVLAVANVDAWLPLAARADAQDVLLLDDMVELEKNETLLEFHFYNKGNISFTRKTSESSSAIKLF